MVFKRIAAVLLWLLVTLTSAFGFVSSELETASGDFFCGTLEDAGRNDSSSRFLCRISDLNRRYMPMVGRNEREKNELFFSEISVIDLDEETLLKCAKELRLVLPKHFS